MSGYCGVFPLAYAAFYIRYIHPTKNISNSRNDTPRYFGLNIFATAGRPCPTSVLVFLYRQRGFGKAFGSSLLNPEWNFVYTRRPRREILYGKDRNRYRKGHFSWTSGFDKRYESHKMVPHTPFRELPLEYPALHLCKYLRDKELLMT